MNSLHAQHFPLVVVGIEHFPRNPLLIYTITGKELKESVSTSPVCSSGHFNPTGAVRVVVSGIMFLRIPISVSGIIRHGNLLSHHVRNDVGHGQRCRKMARLIYPKVKRVFCSTASPGKIVNQ